MRQQIQRRIEEAVRALKAAMEHDIISISEISYCGECGEEAFLPEESKLYLETWVIRYLIEVLDVENGRLEYKSLYPIR